MNRIAITAIALLVSFITCLTAYQKQANSAPTIEQQAQKNDRFELTPWGALKSVKDKSGKEIFGEERSPNEGVAISYQQLHPVTKRPIAPLQVAYFFSDKSTETERCKFCPQSRTAVTSKTKDGILLINSNFFYDPQTGLLKVARFIQNLSNKPVGIYASAQVDARLSTQTPVQFGIVNPKQISGAKIASSTATIAFPAEKASSFATGLVTFDLLPIPCVLCPDRCGGESLITVWPGKDKYLCAECVKGDGSDEVKILWDIRETSTPNCKNPVKLTSTLNSYLVCVDCNSSGDGSILSHDIPLPNPTLLAGKINDERRSCDSNDKENCCKLAIGIDGQIKNVFGGSSLGSASEPGISQNILGSRQVMAIFNVLNPN